MNPDQENNMRTNIADRTHTELIELSIDLQNTIDTHVSVKNGFKSSISLLGGQNEALLMENARLEALAGDGMISEEAEKLQARIAELEEVNTGLQKTIIKLSA